MPQDAVLKFRYIVPFMHYSHTPGDNTYKIINESLRSNKDWIPRSLFLKKEQDIYDYILDSMNGAERYDPIIEKSLGTGNGICSAWAREAGDKGLCRYIDRKGDKNIIIDFRIINVELYMFWNHVGLVCYEIEFDHSLIKNAYSLDDVFEFQNQFIEFGRRGDGKYLLEELSKIYGVSEQVLTDIPVSGKNEEYVELQNQDKEVNWMAREKISPSNRNILINRKYQIHKAAASGSKIAKTFNLTVFKPLNMGFWINHILEPIKDLDGIYIEYFSSRKPFPGRSSNIVIPDKSIVFSYLVSEINDQNELYTKTYRLATGYTERHNPLSDNSVFWNHSTGVLWYGSQQGCGRVIARGEMQSTYYEDMVRSKGLDDYYIMYLLELNQKYGLIYYGKAITEELTQDVDQYVRDNEDLRKKLLRLNAEINLFLMKCSYTSVSNIQKQNEFYFYIRKQLNIEEDINSIKSGLEGLSVLQDSLAQRERERKEAAVSERKSKSDRMLNISLGMLSLLAVISAISDAKALLWNGNLLQKIKMIPQHPYFAALFAFIIIIAIIALINFFRYIMELKKEADEE